MFELDRKRRARRAKEEAELPREVVEMTNYNDIAEYARNNGLSMGKVDSIRKRIIEREHMQVCRQRAIDRIEKEKAALVEVIK